MVWKPSNKLPVINPKLPCVSLMLFFIGLVCCLANKTKPLNVVLKKNAVISTKNKGSGMNMISPRHFIDSL